MKEKIENIVSKVKNALWKYDNDNICVVVDEETDEIIVMYSSINNSFPIYNTDVFKDDIDLGILENEIDKLDVGHCW